ncbi:EamA family transporter RarD [Actinotalea fermentans]|uniref:Protein RarD n=1 Tax=Actinotalea fermentans TaxID=43671 RepID=A0A511Z094_9CELL|nr:EamA family transporter RarD [Actinotalea fermentans]KGM16613.1 membrane protein [Actinotalea fermentans ATCC 43279 = JCM 9966 = DSM 3133]GEN80887.1 protein RarD [Actinotalea fermentans]
MPDPRPLPDRIDRGGLAQGVGAYFLWGLLPLYFPLLAPAGSVEIIAHRVVWSLVFCLLLLALTGGLADLRAALTHRRTLARLGTAGVLIATNWLVYVYGVLSGHTVDGALGYYINPLVTVALAVAVLGERMRRTQWVALGLGAAAVVVITVGMGRLPWISLVLALTFGLYGLVKNRVGRTVGAVTSLTVETAAMAPLAVAYLAFLADDGRLTLARGGWHAAALVALGVVTAVPLLLFGGAARRLPLSVVGMLQYLSPTLQFLVALLVFGEEMPGARWAGFALVWAALVVLTVDGIRSGRPPRRVAELAAQVVDPQETVNQKSPKETVAPTGTRTS